WHPVAGRATDLVGQGCAAPALGRSGVQLHLRGGRPMKLLVTGGAGFIGSNFVHYMLREHADVNIINVDLLTYAGNLDNLRPVEGDARHRFVRADVADREAMEPLFAEGIDAVVHFAAESHVDRSIADPGVFVRTNVLGTQTLLDLALKYKVGRFVQISTDEV